MTTTELQTAKHTPGPWEYLDIGEIVAGDDLGVTIALINDGDASPPASETEANIRLIAAAPDLLTALVWLEDFHLAANENRVTHEQAELHDSMLEFVRAAIVKAEFG